MVSDVYTGDDLLEWLGTDDAARQARRLVRNSGLPAAEAVADDVLQDARLAVWRRIQRGPLEVKKPGGYGTQILRNEVLRILRGRDETDELPDESAAVGGPNVEVNRKWDDPVGAEAVNERVGPWVSVKELDDLRVAVERTEVGQPWVTSAMLSVVSLRAHPEIDLDGVPSPRAGATPDQKLVWPALWFAGQRNHFPEDGDDTKERNRKNKARSRMIGKVLKGCDAAGVLYLLEREPDHG